MSITQKQPYIKRRTGFFQQCALISPSSPDFSAAFASASVPLLRACFASDDGEGEDSGPGVGEESDDEGEGEGNQSEWFFIEDRPAFGLDSGRLDSLHDPAGGFGGSGGGGIDSTRLLVASGGRDRAAAVGG